MTQKIQGLVLVLIALLMMASWGVTCGGGEDTSAGQADDQQGAGGDDDEVDQTGCTDAILFIYDTCSYYIINEGYGLQKDEALTLCVAKTKTDAFWICVLNCAQGFDVCDQLWQCLGYCSE